MTDIHKPKKGATSSSLKAMGAFTPKNGIPKTIEWTSPETGEEFSFDVFVKKQSFGSYALLLKQSEDSPVAGALLIAQCLYEDEQCRKRVLTYEDACDLEPGLAGSFFNVIREVNEGAAAGKSQASTKETNSSTNSSSPGLVDAPSKNSESA